MYRKGSWVGLFASVAPIEDPKYSVVVITRGQSERGKYAAGIAGKVYQALSPQISRNRELLYARQLKTRPAFDSKAAGEDDEGEDADMADAETDGAEGAPIVVGGAQPTQIATAKPTEPEKKLVQKTTQSKPITPVVIEYDRSGAAAPAAVPVEKRERPRVVKNK